MTSPHPAQASSPGCGLSLSLAGGPAGGRSGGCFSQVMDPPARIWGLSGPRRLYFLCWTETVPLAGPGVLFWPKVGGSDAPGSYLPRELRPIAGRSQAVSLFSPGSVPGKAAPSCHSPQAPSVPGVTFPYCHCEVWWGVCMCPDLSFPARGNKQARLLRFSGMPTEGPACIPTGSSGLASRHGAHVSVA